MNNLEKVQAVLKFADEKFSPSGNGASEMDILLDGTDALFEDGKSTYNQSMRWIWMMNYCKQQGIPPAQEWAWNEANRAFESQQSRHHPRGMNPECVYLDELS